MWAKKWIIFGGALAGAMLALLIAFILPVKYSGTATLIIQQGQNGNALSNFLSNNSGGGIAGAILGGGNGISNIENEIAILQSRSLAERMADELLENPIMDNGLLYPILWEDWPDDSVVVSRRILVGRLMGQVKYSTAVEGSIVEVKNSSPSPYEAKKLPNLAMQAYQRFSLEQSRDLTGTTAEYLLDQQEEYRDSLKQSEELLRNYMEANDLVELEAQTQQEIQQYAEMTGKRYEARVQLQAVNASIDEYQKRLNEIKPGLAENLAEAVGNTMQNLQFQISELETERALIYARNPELNGSDELPADIQRINTQLQELKERVQNQTEQLLQSSEEYLGLLAENSSSLINTVIEYSQQLIELKVEQLQYQAQIEALSEQISEKNRFLENVPENSLQLARLKRQVEVQQELYLLVTKQLAQARFQTKSEMAQSRVLDTAILPQSISFPRYWVFAIGGFLFTGFITLAFLSVIIALDDTIYDAYFLKEHGYRVFELRNDKNSSEHSLFAEHLISTLSGQRNNTHAFFSATSGQLTKFVLQNTLATVERKGYTAFSLGEEINSTNIPTEKFGSVSESFANEKEIKNLLKHQSLDSDLIFIHSEDNEQKLSTSRLAESTWIIAEAGVTTLSIIQELESEISDVKGSLRGIILIYNRKKGT